MHVETILNQHRRDTIIILKCEHCGEESECKGYDSTHFYESVVPDWKCQKCGKKASGKIPPRTPKYPEDYVI